MENKTIPKQIIDNIPENLFYHSKTRNKMKIFYNNLYKIISEKIKKKENLINIKKDIFILLKNSFPDIYQYFYIANNFQNLEVFLFCLSNQIELKISKLIENYTSLDFVSNDSEINKMKNNQNNKKDNIQNFFISFYDFFEDELTMDYEDIINSIIEANSVNITQKNIRDKQSKFKEEVNNSFLLSIIKLINLINNISIAKNEFSNIFTEGINGPNSNYYCLNDMGFWIIKIIEEIIRIKNFVLENKNNDFDKKFTKFIEISYFNIIPCLSEFFVKIILDYNLKHTFNVILKKEEFLTLFNQLSSIKLVRQRLLQILSKTDKIFNQDKETQCKKIISKNKILDKIIIYISEDIKQKKYLNAKDILTEIKLFLIYYFNNNISISNFQEEIVAIFNIISENFTKTDKNFNNSFFSFCAEINTFNNSLPEENKFKIYNLMISLFQIYPFFAISIFPTFINNFKDNLELYQDMIGKTNFFTSLVNNLYKFEPEMMNFFFALMTNLYTNFGYFPHTELSKLINSISLFTEVSNVKALVSGLKEFNNLVNRTKKSYNIINQINHPKTQKDSNKNKNISNNQEQEDLNTDILFEELNQTYIDIILKIINEIISQIKQNKMQNLFKPELLYFLFDYIQEIIKKESLYKYFSDKKFPAFFDTFISTPKYKPIAYKIFEVYLKSSMDKENNEAYIKLILNRYNSFSAEGVEEKDEKKIFFVEMNKIKELILMNKTLKTTFMNETLNEKSAIQNKLNNKIVDFILIYLDYINEIKENLYKVYNHQFHHYFKEYLEILFDLIIISNKNVINKQNELSQKLNLENFEKIIHKTLLFFKDYKAIFNNKNNININQSLSNDINNKMKNQKDYNIQNNKINKSYNDNIKEKTSENLPIPGDTLINDNKYNENINKNINNNDNNNIDFSLDIIKYFIDKSLNIPYNRDIKDNLQNRKLHEYYIIKYKIGKSIFSNEKPKNILSNFILQSPIIIITLLNYSYKLNFQLEKVLYIIYLLCITNENNIIYLLKQNILVILLNITKDSKKYNYIILKILNCCFKFLTKEELKQIFEHLIKMFNINNHSFTKELLTSLNSNLDTITGSDYEYTKGIILTNYLVKQPNIYNLITINNINFSCNNNSTIIIKQELFFYTTINSNMKLILLKLENEFFGENKNKQYLEINLYNYDLSVLENDSSKDNNFVLNTKDFVVLDDINVFNYIFNRNENKLSVSVNGKNIFSYEYAFDFPNSEGKKSSKNNNNNNSIFITIGFPIEEVKEYNEPNFFVFQHIKLLSFNIKITNKNKEKKSIYKMKIDKIKLINKPYDNLTNFQLNDDTTLISKYNSYETAKLNCIYYQNNLNIIFHKNIFFINSYLSHAFDYTFRLEKYIFILLNSNNLDKELFQLLINLLCTYFVINREYVICFLTKEEIISSLYFILYKNAKYINKSIVEILFTSLLSYEQLNITIVTDIFLDYQFFAKLNNETKDDLLNLVERKLLSIDDYNNDVILLEKLFYLLILCCNDSDEIKNKVDPKMPSDTNNIKSVDESIVEIICKLIFKNSNVQQFIDKVIEFFYIIFNFHVFVKTHISQYNKGRPKDTYQVILSFFKKMFINDDITKIKNIFIRIFNNKINFDKFTKNKLINLCQTFNPINSNYSFYIKNTSNTEIKKQDLKRNATLENNDDDIIIQKTKILDPKRNSMKITKKEDKKDDNISNNIKICNRKKTLTDEYPYVKSNSASGEDSFIVLGKINYVSIKINLSNKEQIKCDGDCHFCKFIKNIVLNLYKREIKYNIFEKYMLDAYSESYLFNNNLEYNLNFSYYLMKKEGISRIRKNFELKVDKIDNFEIDRTPEKTKNKERKSDFQKLFSFYKNKKYSDNLINMFNLEQIFNAELITKCIEENDSFKNCYNCLLFEGLNYINSVMILSKNKIYILTNVNISDDLLLYNVLTPIPITFWVLDNYTSKLSSQCKYLQMFDYLKNPSLFNNSPESQIFEKDKKGFQIFSFEYKEINELHKKRFLHQNNAIEIFLKNGKNYYLAFNVDLRDTIVEKIIKYLIGQQNTRKKILLINSSNLGNNDDINYNKEIANGSIGTTEILQSPNINNDFNFEIANNSPSSLKNENMIFIRNSNLFIEKEKNPNKNALKNLLFHNKGKKNYCKITDTKEILDQALEKWSNGFLNTYSYIMLLNTLSGRTYNNLAQYPIYPWILKDYSSNEIDLNESNTYRDFMYPIYAQDDETRKNLKMKYESFEDTEVKYHCGSHYSNSLFVCYYLIRVKPFSNISAEIQGNGFDTPDRLFFNIKKFYAVQEKYQELIPEVFNLPELYININNYIYGKTSENILINNVDLPPWALNSPRLFSKMNKKALESQYVSQHINDWIDLIFGYKRSGQEAEKSLNVLKDFFDHLDPKKEEEEIIEGKITELCEMGIDPLQLFNKAHPKRERHQINKAFFGRSVFMTFFEANESENYHIKNFHNSSKIKEIYSYYENKNGILSHGEGGLSSFRIIYENDTNFLKGKANENKEGNIYFIIGEKKSLIPPSFKNFVEYGTKNIFNIVKPFKNMKYSFKIKHMKNCCINCIKVSSDGKHIVIGYDNGVIEKYKLKKVNDCYIEEVITLFNKVENTNDSNSFNKSQNIEPQNIGHLKKMKSKGKSLIKSIFGFKKSKKSETIDDKNNIIQNSPVQNNMNISKAYSTEEIQSKIVVKNPKTFNKQLSMSPSNILNSETILLNNKTNKFIQYISVSSKINQNSNNKDNIEGYYYHSKNTFEVKHLHKKAQNNNDDLNKGYMLFLINASYSILSGVYLIDICDSFSFMLVVDKMNKIYLYDFSSFKLLKYIDISNIFTNQIKFSNICPYTGDFIVSSSKNVVLMNINGLFLSQMNNIPSKINSCCISVIPMTESDLFLFTGHKDGSLIISKLVNNGGNMGLNDNKDSSNIINKLYHETYNNIEKKYRNYLDNNNLSLVFDIVIKIKCSENPIRFIKLTEDLTEIICIDNKNKIIYLNYEKYFLNRKENKNKKNLKVCPMCNAPISSSKILCHLCGKKLCANCKIEKILAEYSFKSPKAICEDCLQIINSTNKMLYDF